MVRRLPNRGLPSCIGVLNAQMHQILTHIKILPTGSVMWPKPTMNFSSRLLTEKASHLPINETHDLVIVNYTVTPRKGVVHKAYIRIVISV